MRWGILDDDGGYFYCITYTQISRSYPRICMKLNGKFGMDLADQLGRRDGEPFREPAELLLQDLQQVLGLVRPLVPAVLESFVEQQESRLIPEQPLDAVLASAAKEEERRLVRFQMEMRYDQCGEPVDGFAHVRVAAGQINVLRHELSD